jgi:gluconokinase
MIVLLTGVSGSGKSTIGSLLAERLHWAFEDGDALHPAANIAKMRAGVPLTDADRWPWLCALGQWMDGRIAAGESAVVACSALKSRYRDLLRQRRPQVRIVFLAADRGVLAARLAARHGHFFGASLLDSQLAALEPPGPGEEVLTVAGTAPPAEVVTEIVSGLGLPAPPPPAPG